MLHRARSFTEKPPHRRDEEELRDELQSFGVSENTSVPEGALGGRWAPTPDQRRLYREATGPGDPHQVCCF